MKPETLAVHASRRRRDGAVAPPIRLSTTFEHGPAYEPIFEHTYVRSGNPNVADLEARLAALEGGAGAVAFASGMAAGSALLGALPPGARVLFHNDLYYDFRKLAAETLKAWRIESDFVDLRDAGAYGRALEKGAALVWFETPSNPGLDIIDIASVAERARAAGARTIVDGTFATPALQKPFDFGADYVLHSLTKYMGGHSDVQGGAIIVRDDAEMLDALLKSRTIVGAVLAPFNAWMIARGLQTLYCRMERHGANAAALAERLDRHPAVERVRYPFLASHPGRDIAKKQMSAGGGMVSIDVKGGREAALRVAGAVKLFINATSLGGVESLIEHRHSVERGVTATPEGLLRLSVGLEHVDDLAADLLQALDAA